MLPRYILLDMPCWFYVQSVHPRCIASCETTKLPGNFKTEPRNEKSCYVLIPVRITALLCQKLVQNLLARNMLTCHRKKMCILNYSNLTTRHATSTFLHMRCVSPKVAGLESIFNLISEEVPLPFMDIQEWTKLQPDNKAAISAVHSLQSFRRLVRVMSHLVAFTQVAGE